MITFKRILGTAKLLSKVESATINPMKPSAFMGLMQMNSFSFAFMSLFENIKTPGQLDPAFKRKTKLKGHAKHKRNNGIVSPKLNQKVKEQKVKLSNHKGMLKRVKIVGPRWDRQFKFRSPHRYHLRRNKSNANLRKKLRARYVHKADIWRVRTLIPYFKRKSLKQKY